MNFARHHFPGPTPRYSEPKVYFPVQSESLKALKQLDVHSGPKRNATIEITPAFC
jgi:hypothetical protein